MKLNELRLLDAHGVCAAAREAHAAVVEAEFTELALAVHWVDLHNADTLEHRRDRDGGGRVLPGTERAVRSGADGTPLVAEFAAVELGALFGMGYQAAAGFVRDAVNLYYRHPRLWAAVETGTVRVWQARRIARATADAGLSLEKAQWVDAQLAAHVGGLPWGQVLDLLEARIIAADPEAAEARRLAAALDRFVRTGRSSEHGLKTLYAKATAGEVIYLTAMIDRIAAILAERGDTDGIDVRRSKALGILGNPAQALALLHQAAVAANDTGSTGADADDKRTDTDGLAPGGELDLDGEPLVREGDLHPAQNDADDPQPERHPCPTCDGEGTVAGDPAGFVKPLTAAQLGRVWPKATLYVHLSAEAFYTGRLSVARVEGVGPVTTAQAVDFLGHTRVSVKPVIDLTVQRSVNAYETPAWMREMVHLLRPVDVFPYGTNTSRNVDLDHPHGYTPTVEGGPDGQTDSHELGPLSRRPHRIRTHGQWQLHQPRPGVWDWRSPHGHWWRVDHTGTHYHGTDPPTDHAA
jgi:hypothetical protein